MNLRHYLLSGVLRSPDDVVAAEPGEVETVVAEAPAAAAEVAAEAEPVGEGAPTAAAVTEAPSPDPAQHGNKGKTPWYMARISEETARRNAEAEARQAAEERARNAEALLQRLQAGDKPDGAPATTRAEPQQDFNAAVRTEAQRVAQAERLNEDTSAVLMAGVGEFPDFRDGLGLLKAIGAVEDDFVLDVLAVDKANAHKIFHTLAKDPEKAAALVGMDGRRRTVELTRMADALKPAAKPAPVADVKPEAPKPSVSRAPAPKPAIAPHAAAAEVDPRTPEGNEKMSDKQFEAWYRDKYMKRAV